MSGFCVEAVGVPQDENHASVSSVSVTVPASSVEPTVMTYGSMPGDSTLPLPWLPAAATTVMPFFHATSTPAANGSVG